MISVVGTATGYRLDCAGIESYWGRDFPNPSRKTLGSNRTAVKLVPRFFPGGKATEPWL